MRGWRIMAIAIFAAAAVLGGGAGAAELAGEALVRALRAGGLTMYFRHAQTDWSRDDHIAKHGDWKSCDPRKMRQLSDTGRETAKRIGRALAALKVPVGRVLSSEYCRAAETVRLMAIGPVTTTTDIMNLRAADFVGGRDAAVGRLRRLLAAPVASGANVVIGAHGNLIQTATGVYPDEAGGAVFRASSNAEHGFEVVARIAADDWAQLAARFGTAD